MIKLTLEVEIEPDAYDGDVLTWVDELVEKGREWGDVKMCRLSNIPSELYVVGRPPTQPKDKTPKRGGCR